MASNPKIIENNDIDFVEIVKRVKGMTESDTSGVLLEMAPRINLHFFAPNDSFCGHVMVEREGVLICWGGTFHDTDSYHPPEKLYILTPQLADSDKTFWFEVDCSAGSVPHPRSGAAGVLIDLNTLIVFGGYAKNRDVEDLEDDSINGMWTNDIYILSLPTLTWQRHKFSEGEERPTPRDKMCSWHYNGSAFFFGGYGYNPGDLLTSTVPGPFLKGEGQFTFNSDADSHFDFAWNNQLLEFDGTYFRSLCQGGSVPSPRAAAASRRKGNFVFLFGGRNGRQRLNDLYRLDMKSTIWTRIETENSPVGRSWATMEITDSGRILLWGGLSTNHDPCSDMWSCALTGGKWIDIGDRLTHRYWHTSALIDGSMIVVGGRSTTTIHRWDDVLSSIPFEPHMEKLRVEPHSLKYLAFKATKWESFEKGEKAVPEPLRSQLRIKYFLSGRIRYCKWFRQLTFSDVMYLGSVAY